MRLITVLYLFLVSSIGSAGVLSAPSAAQSLPPLPSQTPPHGSSQGAPQNLQDLSPSDLLKLFMPKPAPETLGNGRGGTKSPQNFHALDLDRTKRIFDRYRRRLESRDQRKTYQEMADLLVLILTIKKISLDEEDSHAVGREMARIIASAYKTATDTSAGRQSKVRTLYAVLEAPIIIPDGKTQLTYIEAFNGNSGDIIIRLGERSFKLSPNEGVDVPSTDGKCLLIYEELNATRSIAEFTYSCRG